MVKTGKNGKENFPYDIIMRFLVGFVGFFFTFLSDDIK